MANGNGREWEVVTDPELTAALDRLFTEEYLAAQEPEADGWNDDKNADTY